jgi:hypothetical protein
VEVALVVLEGERQIQPRLELQRAEVEHRLGHAFLKERIPPAGLLPATPGGLDYARRRSSATSKRSTERDGARYLR